MPNLKTTLVVGKKSIWKHFAKYLLYLAPSYCLHKFTMKSVITFDRSVHMNDHHPS